MKQNYAYEGEVKAKKIKTKLKPFELLEKSALPFGSALGIRKCKVKLNSVQKILPCIYVYVYIQH